MRRRLAIALALTLGASAADIPRRIVSLSPDVTEMLYGMGAFGQLAGISDYSTYPPETRRLPRVGAWPTPDLEKLLGLHPDLVIADKAQFPFLRDQVQELGFRILAVPNHTVEDVYSAMAELGRATGHDAAAARLAEATREGLREVARRTAGLPRVRVVLIIDRTPGTLRDLYTATTGSFLAELVEIAGGQVAAHPAPTGYAKLSKEDLLAIQPEVILDFTHEAPGRLAASPLEARQEMPELRAVRSGRVYSVNQDYVPRASQRMVETAGLFARLLHAEVR